MGELDLLKPILENRGKVHFGRVLMKPGKPLTFATVKRREEENKEVIVFGLPGNPVSCLVTFQLFVLPALRKLSGHPNPLSPTVDAVMMSKIRLDKHRPEYHRVSLSWDQQTSQYLAHTTGEQRSSRLLSMRSADGLAHVPAGEGYLSNTKLPVTLI